MTCSSCGYDNPEKTLFCLRCGSPTPAAQRGQTETQADSEPKPPPPNPAATVAASPAPTQPQQGYGGPATRSKEAYAGFWVRFFAAVIDGIIVWIAQMLVAIPVMLAVGLGGGLSTLEQGGMALSYLISIPIAWLYEALMTSSAKQATVGKIALGLRVTDLDGERITFARASGRHFSKYVSKLILLVGYLIQPFTPKRQALHDIMAGTLVE